MISAQDANINASTTDIRVSCARAPKLTTLYLICIYMCSARLRLRLMMLGSFLLCVFWVGREYSKFYRPVELDGERLTKSLNFIIEFGWACEKSSLACMHTLCQLQHTNACTSISIEIFAFLLLLLHVVIQYTIYVRMISVTSVCHFH